jgi:hypothetical protein
MSVKTLLNRMEGGGVRPGTGPTLPLSAREGGLPQGGPAPVSGVPAGATGPTQGAPQGAGALGALLGVHPSPRDPVSGHMVLPLSEIQNSPSLTSLQVALHALQLLPEGSEPYKLQMQHIQVCAPTWDEGMLARRKLPPHSPHPPAPSHDSCPHAPLSCTSLLQPLCHASHPPPPPPLKSMPRMRPAPLSFLVPPCTPVGFLEPHCASVRDGPDVPTEGPEPTQEGHGAVRGRDRT